MYKIVLATTNPSKKIEIAKGLSGLSEEQLKLISLDDFDIQGSPIESGDTFEENARIKAKFYGDQIGLPVIADDGGLMIDALEGQPGVKSRRWPGYEATDEELIRYALDRMKHIPEGKRTAQLVTCVCLYLPQNNTYFCQQEGIEGHIATEASTWDTNGYPYRALFVVKEYNKFYDDLTEVEHHQVNHRLKALQKLKKHIQREIFV